MSPTDLGEYILAAGFSITALVWINWLIAGFFGFWDKDK